MRRYDRTRQLLALGLAFRANQDFLFPYYRDLLTSLAAGMSAEDAKTQAILAKRLELPGAAKSKQAFAKKWGKLREVMVQMSKQKTLENMGGLFQVYGQEKIQQNT